MFSYISEGEPSEYGFLPAGVYEGKIVKMEEGISQGAKTRGCPQLAVHIRAFGPEGAATVRYYLTNSKDLAWKIDLFVKNVTGNVYQPGQQVIINPAEYFEPGMDGDDLMFMWEQVQRSGLINIWRFQSMEDIEASFGLMGLKVPPVWSGKDATFSTGCTKEMRIALDMQRSHPELQIVGPGPEKFFRRGDYGVGKFFDATISNANQE